MWGIGHRVEKTDLMGTLRRDPCARERHFLEHGSRDLTREALRAGPSWNNANTTLRKCERRIGILFWRILRHRKAKKSDIIRVVEFYAFPVHDVINDAVEVFSKRTKLKTPIGDVMALR